MASDVDLKVDKPETVPGVVAFEFKKIAGEVKDIRVEKGGKPLVVKDFLMPDGWEGKDGAFAAQDGGTLKYGDPVWEDYTASVKVKFDKFLDDKDNGFALHFGQSDKMDCSLTIYGSGKKSQIAGCDNAYGEKPVNFDDGAWHDVKVEINGLHVRAWVDGELLHDITMRAINVFVVGSGIDSKTGEVVIKVVNSYPRTDYERHQL